MFLDCGNLFGKKKGTINTFALVLIMAFFTSTAVGANAVSIAQHGFSGVNYGLYAYVIVDYCFVFRKETRTKFNVVSGAVLIALIYFAMCFNGGTSTVSFAWYPYDFMHNMGHYSSFLAGAVLGITVQTVKLIARKEAKQ